jgi:hypothetical protein
LQANLEKHVFALVDCPHGKDLAERSIFIRQLLLDDAPRKKLNVPRTSSAEICHSLKVTGALFLSPER